MAIHNSTQNLPAFHKAVITIGFFDGVHSGHRAILSEVVECAKEIGGESVLITFEPHPRKLLYPSQSLQLLTPLHEKLQLLTAAGIQHVVVVPFTREFSLLSATEYIGQFLARLFKPAVIVIGYDHRFGHDRAGDIDLLKQYANQYGYAVREIPARLIDDAAVSSTEIRHALQDGRVADAAHMLGREYCIKGTVIKGAQLGRTLGYPTANIQPHDTEQLVPGNGIYTVRARHNGTLYGGMCSIGVNPTVTDEQVVHIEVNIFGFDSDIYGETLEVFFVQKLRDEAKFASLDELKEQIGRDKADSEKILSNR